MEDAILISNLNDFIFCPASIYFHNLYGDVERVLFQEPSQLNGTDAHISIDTKTYSTSKDILQGVSVYCEKYNIIGKIDMFNQLSGLLSERKRKIKTIYDGYIFQVYAQYFALTEMGYNVKRIILYSMEDNISYKVSLPAENPIMLKKFEDTVGAMVQFDLHGFKQSNKEKCANCIYEPLCDSSLL